MVAEDRRNSGLNLLFLLAQAYYKILEYVISTASWCCSLDLELNESYLWTITNLKNLLANHKDLQDFPGTFEPAFPDLYPSTIRDVDWEDMVAPDVEQFLSTVQEYVRSKGAYSPEELSPSWAFIEMFRPSIETAIERAVAYNKRMRNYAQETFGKNSGAKPAVQATPTADLPKGFDGLGQKKTDLSQYFDDVSLTDRQRERASMKWEYGLRDREIARRLGLHHKTVQESLHAVGKRLERDENFKRALKRRIAHHGSRDESY